MQSVHAQTTDCNSQIASNTFKPLACYNGAGDLQKAITSADQPNNLATYFNAVFRIMLSVGAFLAVLRITWAGYLYMGSADMWSNKETAKKMFTDAIIGLLLLFGVYLILFQINDKILNLNTLNELGGLQKTVGQAVDAVNTVQSGVSQVIGGQPCITINGVCPNQPVDTVAPLTPNQLNTIVNNPGGSI
jgi:hypothetical protein